MSNTFTLDAIGLKHRTDKASSHHDYLNFYESIFAPLRNEQLNILEIGVLDGASLKTWEEYFPKSKIIGADIVPASKRFEQGAITIELIDQSNVEELTSLAIKYGPFDIIVEDGSHMWEHQITSMRTLFPFLRNGGIYVVEDLQTNYGSMQVGYKGVATSPCVDYLKRWLDLLVGDDQIAIANVEDAFLRTYGRAAQFITFYRRACLIKKQFRLPKETTAGQPLVASVEDRHSVALKILAHISEKGDVYGAAGFINLGSDTFTFQGLSINCDEELVEYRVGWADKTWSAWSRNGSFAGTRGQSKLLTGFAIRLQAHVLEQYELQAYGRFVGQENPVNISDGQEITAVFGGALCGLQVQLLRSSS